MNAAAKRTFTRARSRSRRFAMQAIYQWQMTGQDLALIDAQFLAEEDLEGVDVAYFQELLHQVPYRADHLNRVLEPFLDRPLAQVDPVERSILWIAAYELTYRPDVPFRVVINEAVELAKKFGAEQGHRFVNGVLDKAARVVR